MAKPKLSDFKKFVASLDETELRAEMHKLFQKLPQVQEFYAQELLSEADRKAMLADYKKKIDKQFWTRGGNPRIASNAELRKIISDFEKISIFPNELVDLLIYRVETMTDFASQFGGAPDAEYNAALTAFQKAMKLIAEHKLHSYFKERCLQLFKTDNIDGWYIDELEQLYEEYFGHG